MDFRKNQILEFRETGLIIQLSIDKKIYTEKQRIMREPFMDEFPEHLQKIRRNLLVTGSASIVYKLSGVSLAADGSFLGVKYCGLKTSAIEWILVVVVVYLLIHFIWAAAEHFHKWRLRLTGVKDQRIDLNGDENTPYPEDVSKYTLYNWWLGESVYINNRIRWLKETEGLLSRFKIFMSENEDDRMWLDVWNSDFSAALKKINDMQSDDHRLITSRQEFGKLIQGFDTKFWRYQKSRVYRFFIIEYGLPILVGLGGVAMLFGGMK